MQASDVVIIGGGINGAAIAFNLAERGVKVTLVEKSSIASGPTGRSVGIIRQHYSNAITAKMALRALRIFQNFEDAVGGHCDFVQTGFLLASSAAELEVLEANVAMQRSIGIDARVLTTQELRELEPDLDTRGIVAAAYEPEAGYADPHSTTMAYVNRAEELGAEIHTGTRVDSLVEESGRVTGVRTDGGLLPAGAVVLAAGPWSAGLAAGAGIDLPVTPYRSDVCYFERAPEMSCNSIFIDSSVGLYVRPESGRLLLVGSVETKAVDAPAIDPDRFSEVLDFDFVGTCAERLTRRYPAMAQGTSAGGYASLYDITPDWHPILGRLPMLDGLYCATGSSGHGFKLAPVVGEVMASLIVDGEVGVEDLDLGAGDLGLFEIDRFASGSVASGGYDHDILG